MKTDQEYIQDLSEIRSMMERSTRFLSLTGWSGILAGIYALLGVFAAHLLFEHEAKEPLLSTFQRQEVTSSTVLIFLLAVGVLLLAVSTAIWLSSRKAARNQEKLWNPVARRLVVNMAIPLFTGGFLILLLIMKGALGFVAPFSLIFYGLALTNASKFTFHELRSLGLIQIFLGLISTYFMEYSLEIWGLGFGLMHIAYGIYMHQKYEK